jgi:hypothetical protein
MTAIPEAGSVIHGRLGRGRGGVEADQFFARCSVNSAEGISHSAARERLFCSYWSEAMRKKAIFCRS